MPKIPREALDYLTQEINGISAEAQQQVMRVLERVDWSDVSSARGVVVEAVQIALANATELAAQASADFYDASRELCVGKPLGAVALSGYEPDATEGAIRSFVRYVTENGNVGQFNDQVLQRIDYECKRAAGYSMTENGSRDPLKPRYARVPTGPETCLFCLMLASRGFVYHSKKSAGAVNHYHANCDCRVVCGFDGAEVEGYDPDEFYEQWKSGVAAKEDAIRKRINREWSGYIESDSEESYYATVGEYVRSFTVDGSVDCEFMAKPLAKELMAARALSKNGHSVFFLKVTEGYKVKNPDCIIDGGRVFDFKRIESDNPSKIFQNIKRSSGQASRFVIDLLISRISQEDARREARNAVLSDETSAVEVLILYADGSEELIT